ncbi:hypothetical protein CDA63_16445 [Hymenobacter amundsenii]|uniref:Lipoprotein n=1 Tax=Hymenobacter amundsenii TaxID=2006685 RepID=A0A246FHM5_9BACT|nr:hypothetical protein [Hymenobacter amundsenii]OWP62018.1 hypothetical protein CDA63_16445 [Hymenobacter amundsenii]
MKRHIFSSQLVAFALLTACQSSPNQPAVLKATTPGLTSLSGTWVENRESGFILIKINQDSTGTYTRFTDRGKEMSHKTLVDRYFFYESPIRVKYKPDQGYGARVAIHTHRFRFDYELIGDTLREYDKMGYQGSLIKMKPEEKQPFN